MNTPMLSRDIMNGYKVLVVDDEPHSLDVVRRVLRFYGAEITGANNGQEGLEQIRSLRPDLVISDISMPVLDGWGLIKVVKNDRSLMDIPVIALTAHAMNGDREKALAAGFHNYLTKPLTPQTFMKDLLILIVDLPQFEGLAQKLK